MAEQTLFGTVGASPPRGEGVYVRVVVERGIEGGAGDTGLTYSCEGEAPVVGERVEVPLGRGGKAAGGIVVEVGGAELLEGLEASRVKSVLERSGTRLPPELVELGRWMSEYYVCPLGMVLSTLMPAAVKKKTGAKIVEVISLAPGAGSRDAATLRPAARRAWERIGGLGVGALPAPLGQVAAMIELKTPRALRELVEAGFLAVAELESVHARAMHGERENGSSSPALAGSGGPALAPQQALAVDAVSADLGRFAAHVLFGVTGSGKTEVYLRLIARVLEAGRTAIVLVPEISLTPQTASRFTRRFPGGRVAVLHSGLTPAQRHREWARAASGGASVVVGARSAIFAPLRDLGLIVVDEEHDGSYKQDQLPRYNGRDVAVKRAQMAGCPVVLGSATPSLESWANVEAGRYRVSALSRRVVGEMPRVEIVDMREEARLRRADPIGEPHRLHLLGPTLEKALEETLAGSGQAILLLNRRGFAHRVCCQKAACGFVLSCSLCDANLVVHRVSVVPAGVIVRCHHCLSEQRVPRLCPSCGGKLSVLGGGTQRLEEELAGKFAAAGLKPGEGFVRLDSDSMRGAGDYFSALERFGKGEVRLLIGTQMIAKGLDFPNVRLVGVVDADTALAIPDFRAGERTFQLVSQVAGRAGRGEHPGRVIVQTFCPADPAIALAARHDYPAFAKEELAARARAGVPPATRMARIVCRDESAERAEERARGLAELLRAEAQRAARNEPGAIRVAGPMPCTIARIAAQYRFAIDVYGSRAGHVQEVLRAARAAGRLTSDAVTAVDVDPVALM